MSVSPALVGVGYILGTRIAGVMVAGGALSALVSIPAHLAALAFACTPARRGRRV